MLHAHRKTPEELLREAESHESALKKGYLKIFLGYKDETFSRFKKRGNERGSEKFEAYLFTLT